MIKEIITLEEPDILKQNKVVATLLNVYNKDQLTKILQEIRHKISSKYSIRIGNNELNYDSKAIYKLNKQEIAEFISIFLSSKQNFLTYYSRLSIDFQTVWIKLLEVTYISNHKLERILKRELLPPSNRLYYSSWEREGTEALDREMVWFQKKSIKLRKWEFRSDTDPSEFEDICWSIPSFIIGLVASFLIPEETEIRRYDSENVIKLFDKSFNDNEKILVNISILKGFAENGNLNIEKDKLPAVTFKKISSQIKFDEFYSGLKDKTFNTLRSKLVINSVAYYYDLIPHLKNNNDYDTLMAEADTAYKNCHENILFIAKLLFTIRNSTYLQTEIFMSHYSGWKNLISYSNITQISINLWRILYALDDSDAWYDIDSIIKRLNPYNCGPSIYDNIIYRELKIKNTKLKLEVNLTNSKELLYTPIIKEWIWLLASFGLLKIYYYDQDEEFDDTISYYDNITCFKFTDLGKYLFKKTNSYTPSYTSTQNIKYFELEEDKLIISSTVEDNPYTSILESMSTYIGNKRYSISYDSFLKQCNTINDVKDRIDFFKKYITNEYSAKWNEFFSTLEKRSQPLIPIESTKYVIYKVNFLDKELIKILNTDPYISKNTLKTENQMILIPKTYQKEVLQKLKAYGYII